MSLAEFEQVIKGIQAYSEASKKGFGLGYTRFERAERAYRRAERIREKMLQEILKEKDLAICSHGFLHDGIDKKNPTLKQLGVYPREKMRLFFHKSLSVERNNEYYTHSDPGGIHILLLCPECFPKNPNSIEGEASLSKLDQCEINSEILREGKKFILAVNRWDVTSIAKGKQGDNGLIWVEEIELDGERYPDAAVYRHFGIPDLPEEPEIGI